MEYAYAIMLLHEAKKPVNEENLKKVLNAAGVEVSEAKIKAIVVSLEGLNIDDVLKQAVSTPAPSAPQQKEEKKDEKSEEKKEEEAAAGLASLFG
jgi:large subunit ribosomal protein L12